MCKTIGLVKINEFCYGFDDRSNIYVSEYDFYTGDYSKLYVVTPRHDGVRFQCLRYAYGVLDEASAFISEFRQDDAFETDIYQHSINEVLETIYKRTFYSAKLKYSKG
nr:MAG TPA: hypothetical protein [Caudoviricetes sp.]